MSRPLKLLIVFSVFFFSKAIALEGQDKPTSLLLINEAYVRKNEQAVFVDLEIQLKNENNIPELENLTFVERYTGEEINVLNSLKGINGSYYTFSLSFFRTEAHFLSIRIVDSNAISLDEWDFTNFENDVRLGRIPDGTDDIFVLENSSLGHSNLGSKTGNIVNNQALLSTSKNQPSVRSKIEDINIFGPTDLLTKREDLIEYVWGTDGLPKYDSSVFYAEDVIVPAYELLKNSSYNLSRIDRLDIALPYSFKSKIFLFNPIRSNDKLVIYHAGHSWNGFMSEDIEVNGDGEAPGLVIPELVKLGYTVMACSMPLYGNNHPTIFLEDQGYITILNHNQIFSYLDRPFRYFLEPVTVGLNFILKKKDYEDIHMMGLSGGGWTTTVYSAIDSRIRLSFPVAGSTPIPLRAEEPTDVPDREQIDEGFYQIANYSELYLMGSIGRQRQQLQILNKYDNCCFAFDGSGWVENVKSSTLQFPEGNFQFLLDTVATSHKISRNALAVILSEMERPSIIIETNDANDSLTLICSNLSPKYKWYVNGVEYGDLDGIIKVSNDNAYYQVSLLNESDTIISTSRKVFHEDIYGHLSKKMDYFALRKEEAFERIELYESVQIIWYFEGEETTSLDSYGVYTATYFQEKTQKTANLLFLPEQLIHRPVKAYNCQGDSITLSSVPIPNTKMKWYFNNKLISQNMNIIAKESGSYSAWLLDMHQNILLKDSINLEFYSIPDIKLTENNRAYFYNDEEAYITFDTLLNDPHVKHFKDLNYTWYLNNDPFYPDITKNSFQVTRSGTYMAQVKNGICHSESELIIFILSREDDLKAFNVNVTPNPFTTIIRINIFLTDNTYIRPSQLKVSLYNNLFQEVRGLDIVYDMKKAFLTAEVDLSELSKGLYYLSTQLESSHKWTKVIKE